MGMGGLGRSKKDCLEMPSVDLGKGDGPVGDKVLYIHTTVGSMGSGLMTVLRHRNGSIALCRISIIAALRVGDCSQRGRGC